MKHMINYMPGYVTEALDEQPWVENPKVKELKTKRVGMPRDKFVEEYLYHMPKGYSIRERSNYDCYFFGNGKCNIYAVRPTHCRTWPFWLSNVRTRTDWAEVHENCPGIGQGRLHTKEEVLTRVEQRF